MKWLKGGLIVATSLGMFSSVFWPQIQKRKMTRRDFLRTGFFTAATLAIGQSVDVDPNELRFVHTRGRQGNRLGFALYELDDWRDVIAAKALDFLTRESRDLGPIAVIYGEGHRTAIKHYSQSPQERDIKYAAYLPYRFIVTPQLRRYVPAEDGSWKQLKRMAI